jgi:IS5 family transposase
MLRMLGIKHLYGWSLPQTAHAVSDRLVLRQFCRVYVAPVPDQSTLHRWAKRLQPASLHRLLDHLVHLACQLQMTQGRTLRLDGTVVATTLHHPTDRTLLYDGVRGLSRVLGKTTTLRRESAGVTPEATTHFAQQARDKMTQIMEVARQRGEAAAERLKTTYRDLIDLATTVVARAKYAQEVVTAQTTAASQRVAGTLVRFIPLVEQVITQTTRRVLQGEQVPANEKIVSLFEPDTAIIRKGKPGKPTEFGRVLWLDEVEGGLISRYAVLDGNPDEKSPTAAEPGPSLPAVWPSAHPADG